MNHLLPLILACLLLCGCGRTAPPDTAVPLPTESVAGSVSEPEEYGGRSTNSAPEPKQGSGASFV